MSIPFQCDGCKHLSNFMPITMGIDIPICTCQKVIDEHEMCCSHTAYCIGIKIDHAIKFHCTKGEHYEQSNTKETSE